MNLMNALLDTYDFAQKNDLVDNHRISNRGHVLLPVFHSNKRSNGEDIFEIVIDEDGNAIDGGFLEKDRVIIFPITEESITRSGAKIAPHGICDELSYLASNIDKDKNKKYLEGIYNLLEYEKTCNNENFKIIGKYINDNEILDDFLKYYLRNNDYKIDNKWILKFEVTESNGKTKEKSIDLKKVFITFKINKLFEADITVTRDVEIHKFYINYLEEANGKSVEQSYCNITGEMDYCSEKHRGIMGMAKLVSVSNNNETYYGRIKNPDDIYHMSFEASQKVHNMLKYFLDSNEYKTYIGEGAYLINWLSHDLDKGSVDLVSDFYYEDDEFPDLESQDLGEALSHKLGEYFLGNNNMFISEGDFYILIIEKISNGRVSIKYFRRLSRSEAYSRVTAWYRSTEWNLYDFGSKRYMTKSPTLYQIVNLIYGMENSKGIISCENKKLMRTSIERLIPCVVESKRIPRDMIRAVHYKLSNKRSYKKTWNTALAIGCSIIKKGMKDYEGIDISHNTLGEVERLEKSRSFHYGRLIAVYEKIELDATGTRSIDSGKEKGQVGRITNADRLWNSMIRTPERTRFILETKVKPYMNILKRNRMDYYIFYDKIITSISMEISELKEANNKVIGSLNEDFILGYYYQKDKFYSKKKDNSKDNEVNNKEE